MFGLLVSLLVCHQGILASSEVKVAIKAAARKAVWGWTKSRTLPLFAGAAMIAVPPVIAAVGFMGAVSKSGTGMTETQSNVFAGMMIGGYGLSVVLAPLGTILVGRQAFLMSRDIHLFKKFTKSTSHLNLNNRSLPSPATIAKMNTHDELLNMGANYLKEDGNVFEWLPFVVPGFRGYKVAK